MTHKKTKPRMMWILEWTEKMATEPVGLWSEIYDSERKARNAMKYLEKKYLENTYLHIKFRPIKFIEVLPKRRRAR